MVFLCAGNDFCACSPPEETEAGVVLQLLPACTGENLVRDCSSAEARLLLPDRDHEDD